MGFRTVYKIVDQDGGVIDPELFYPTKPFDDPIPMRLVNVEMVVMRDGEKIIIHTLEYLHGQEHGETSAIQI